MAKTDHRVLPVRTVFYLGRKVVRTIAAGKPLNAVANCTKHMRKNSYQATKAEVYNTSNGELYAVMRMDVKGNLHILYQAPPKKEELE